MRFYLLAISMVIGINVVLGQEKGRFTQLAGGLLTYGPITKELGYTFTAIHSLNIKPNFSAGLGLGFEKYMLNETEGNSFKGLPLFAQAKYVLRPDKSKSLYGAFDLGYSPSLNKSEESTNTKISNKGGLLASPQIGVLWYTNKAKKLHINFSIAYKYQGFNENRYFNYTAWVLEANDSSTIKNDEILSGYDNYTNSKYHLHRLSVMLGIGF